MNLIDQPNDEPVVVAPVVINDEPGTLVERVAHQHGQLVHKVHTFRGWPSWRTFLRRSRADREYRNLVALRAAGVPAVRAHRWSEQRRLGRVVSCELWTWFVEDACDLRQLLRSELAPERRRALAVGFGRLLRKLHRAGFCSSTGSPRNVLAPQGPEGGELLLLDQPHASRLRPSVARWGRGLDLFDAFFSASRLREWTRSQRFRGLLAYADGDRELARRIWREVSRRGRLWYRCVRQLSRLAILRVPQAAAPSR